MREKTCAVFKEMDLLSPTLLRESETISRTSGQRFIHRRASAIMGGDVVNQKGLCKEAKTFVLFRRSLRPVMHRHGFLSTVRNSVAVLLMICAGYVVIVEVTFSGRANKFDYFTKH